MVRVTKCDKCGKELEPHSAHIISMNRGDFHYCGEHYYPLLDYLRKYNNQDNEVIHIPEPTKDDKPSAEIGTKPGAGNPKPTKTRNGNINRAMVWLEKELDTRNEILMVDAQKETGISSGSVWMGVQNLINEQSSVYEYYKDTTRKYHPKGIRKIEVVE